MQFWLRPGHIKNNFRHCHFCPHTETFWNRFRKPSLLPPRYNAKKTKTYLAVGGTNSANISLICYIGRLTEANSARADTTYLSTSTAKLQAFFRKFSQSISFHGSFYGISRLISNTLTMNIIGRPASMSRLSLLFGPTFPITPLCQRKSLSFGPLNHSPTTRPLSPHGTPGG